MYTSFVSLSGLIRLKTALALAHPRKKNGAQGKENVWPLIIIFKGTFYCAEKK